MTIKLPFFFLVLFFASLAFARRLHLFDPVLLHHYDPSTGEDELVAPGDKAFDEEAEKLEEKREERREELALRLLGQEAAGERPEEMLAAASSRFDAARIPAGPLRLDPVRRSAAGERH